MWIPAEKNVNVNGNENWNENYSINKKGNEMLLEIRKGTGIGIRMGIGIEM